MQNRVATALIVVAVIAAVVGLTVWLVHIYPSAPKNTEGILGIVMPTLTAAIGAVAGYAGGHLTGRAQGRQAGKDEVRGPLLQRINTLGQRAGVVDTIRNHAMSPPNSDRWFLASNFENNNRVDLGQLDDLDLAGQINNLRDYVQHM